MAHRSSHSPAAGFCMERDPDVSLHVQKVRRNEEGSICSSCKSTSLLRFQIDSSVCTHILSPPLDTASYQASFASKILSNRRCTSPGITLASHPSSLRLSSRQCYLCHIIEGNQAPRKVLQWFPLVLCLSFNPPCYMLALWYHVHFLS